MFNLDKEIKDKISLICFIYFENRKIFIQAEEAFVDMNMFIAPLVEHRDAFDHFIRFFEKFLKNKEENTEQQKYEIIKELDSVLSHELRAFYDVADYICINIRDYISTALNKMKPKQIRKIWAEYDIKKQEILELSKQISKVRNERRSSIDSVKNYINEIMPKIFSIYNDFIQKFETQIRAKLIN